MTSIQMASLGKGPAPRRSPSPLPLPAGSSASGGVLLTSMRNPHENVLSYWVTHRLFSPDRVERHYAFLLAMLVLASVLFGLLKPVGPVFLWGSPICTVWSTAIIGVTLLNVWAEQRERWVLFEATRGVQFLLAMLAVLIYYEGSNVINRYRYEKRGDAMLYDEVLLRMDEALWGWLWPKGQMSLWLDTQPSFGVTTPIGRAYAELFQILYVSYYFWGNAIGVILAAKYFWFSVYKKNKGTRKRLQWRCIQMFVSAWVGGFVFNHLVNLCFPAVSPRIYLAEHFRNEVRGLWVLGAMRNAITNAAANTFSAFPSGHCGLSILAALLAFRIHLSRAYTVAVCVSTVLIVLATQVLRYHYFVDFAFSALVVVFGAWLGGFHDVALFKHSLAAMGLEDVDEEGKALLLGMQSPDGGAGNGSGGAFDRDMGSPMIALSSPSGSGEARGLLSTSRGSGGGDDEELVDDEHERDDEDDAAQQARNPPLVLSAGVFGTGKSGSQSMVRAVSSQKIAGAAQASEDKV